MRIAYPLFLRNRVGGNDGLAVVQRSIAEPVRADGITDLFLFGSVTCEIGKKVSYFLFGLEGCGACECTGTHKANA